MASAVHRPRLRDRYRSLRYEAPGDPCRILDRMAANSQGFAGRARSAPGGRSAWPHSGTSGCRPSSGKMTAMVEISLSVPAYDPAIGVVAPAEGGTVSVEVRGGAVEIFGDPAGLRDLARMCLALSDSRAPDGAHIHLDPGINPVDLGSASLTLARHTSPLRP